jgi:hypothetical protein
MIAPHKCILITYLIIAQFVEYIVNLQEKKKDTIKPTPCFRSSDTTLNYTTLHGAEYYSRDP